jgi:glycine/D-amino acid oxidase-like deaminating enzyme
VLRKDTIAKLKEGCGGASKHFGQFLQDHLDRYPLPDRETYLFRQNIEAIERNRHENGLWMKPGDKRRATIWDNQERYMRDLKRKQRDHVREVKAREREEGLQAKMTPKERAARKAELKRMKALREARAKNIAVGVAQIEKELTEEAARRP